MIVTVDVIAQKDMMILAGSYFRGQAVSPVKRGHGVWTRSTCSEKLDQVVTLTVNDAADRDWTAIYKTG